MARYIGDQFNNQYIGTNERDEIFGNGGNDNLLGAGGNDLIDGGSGDDALEGGDGDDEIYAGDGDDSVYGGTGNDLIEGGDGWDLLIGEAGDDTLRGGSGDDFLIGNEGRDLLQGGDGHDELSGDEGDDRLEGGLGSDILIGGIGTDLLIGGAGHDRYVLTDGNDTIVETADGGIDTLDLNFNANVMYVLAANLENLRLGDAAHSSAQGNGLDNTLTGNDNNNLLYGLAGNDWLLGADGDDTLQGGDGRDTLLGGAGRDELNGGAGGDRFVFLDPTLDSIDQITNFNASEDFIALNVQPFSLGGGYSRAGFTPESYIAANQFHAGTTAADVSDRLIYDQATGKLYFDEDGTGAIAQVQIAQMQVGLALSHLNFYAYTELRPIDQQGQSGTPNNDVFVGSNNDDLYYGLGGNDTISGRGGDDSLNGGDGNDQINGEQGSDRLFGDAGLDTLNGGAGDDVLVGGDGNDILDGGTGIDNLQGGNGSDRYYVDHTSDYIIELDASIAVGGVDEVIASATHTLSAYVENLTLADGAGAINGTGNSLDNVIKGNDAANILQGGQGNDSLTGGRGRDRFDFLSYGDGVDQITDFNSADDQIGIYLGLPAQLPPGSPPAKDFEGLSVVNASLAADQFHVGTAAADESDRFIYDRATGKLFYDRDGTGSAASVQLATLSPNLELTHNNIYVFGPGTPSQPSPPPRPHLSVSDVTVTEGNNGTTTAVFTVTLSAASTAPVSINYATANGTAIAGQDYTAQTGTLTFASGETSKTISIQITGDQAIELDETLRLVLTDPTNATISRATGVGTILNDDRNPHQGTNGNDNITGSAGDDLMVGNDGNDRLAGGKGNDQIYGGNGNDRIFGGNGSDRIWGGSGSDVISSGGGRDVIALERGIGVDRITDFQNSVDKLGLVGMRFGQLDIVQQGRNTLIRLDNDPLAVLVGVRANQINAADFTRMTAS